MSLSGIILFGLIGVAHISAQQEFIPQPQPGTYQNNYYDPNVNNPNQPAYNTFQSSYTNNQSPYSQQESQQQQQPNYVEPTQPGEVRPELHEKVTTSCLIPFAITCWTNCARQTEFSIPNCCKRVGLKRFSCDCVPVRTGVHGESTTLVDKLKQMIICGIASIGGFVTGNNLNSENVQ